MDIQQILSKCDHTLLSPTASWHDVQALCDDALAYGTASVCIAPCHVARAKAYLGKRLAVCTVIGFPLGYNTTESKVFETADAVRNGADEIDMVINVGALIEGDDQYVLDEICAVREACRGRILKVIVETCYLNEQQKLRACDLVSRSGADYIKTSTGFGSGGATPEDVALLVANVAAGVKVKAAGGIAGLEDAEQYIRLGASRLGTSRVVKAVKALQDK